MKVTGTVDIKLIAVFPGHAHANCLRNQFDGLCRPDSRRCTGSFRLLSLEASFCGEFEDTRQALDKPDQVELAVC